MQVERRLLANWQQAIATFNRLYKAVELALEQNKLASCHSPEADKSTAEELERLRHEMIDELKWLSQNVNDSRGSQLLQQHTRRINGHNQRVQKALSALKQRY